MGRSIYCKLNQIRSFNAERHWQRFHSPKNLTMALGVEVAELAEHCQVRDHELGIELNCTPYSSVSMNKLVMVRQLIPA